MRIFINGSDYGPYFNTYRWNVLNLGVYEKGNIYRSARNLANLTQRQLAEKTGMTIPEISKIENGRTMPTAEQHKLIERACGVKI